MSKTEAVKINLKFKIWIESVDGFSIMGDGKWLLLKEIRDQGSLMAAIEKLGLDYRRTWGNLKKIENRLGFRVVEKTRGGRQGGHTELTIMGKKLVAAFDAAHELLDKSYQQALTVFAETLGKN